MKEKIHPEYYPEAKVTCSCGNVFTIGSTQKDIKTEICFKCHPFYTGEQKIIDAQGQVQKFKKRWDKKK
jgi:large subunit ribosomal protein L31